LRDVDEKRLQEPPVMVTVEEKSTQEREYLRLMWVLLGVCVSCLVLAVLVEVLFIKFG